MGLLRRRAIGLAVLAVLACAPLSGAVCDIVCASAAGGAGSDSHHASAAAHCQEPESGEPQIAAMPGHACDHDRAVRDAETALTPSRTDAALSSGMYAVAAVAPHAFTPAAVRVRSGAGPPHGEVSPLRPPLVLRI